MIDASKPPHRASIELWTALGIAALFALAMLGIRLTDVAHMRGDTAIVLQATENAMRTGIPDSQVFASTQGFLDAGYPTKTAAQIARDPLAPPVPPVRNILGFHAYFVVYVLSVLARVLSVPVVVFGALVASFSALLLFAFLLLRKRGVDLPLTLAFCVLVASYPAWWYPLAYGQPFFDFLYAAIGFAFCVIFTRASAPVWMLVLVSLAAAMVNERAAIVSGLFGLGYLLLHRKELPRRTLRIALAAALLLYGIVMIKIVLVNPEYGGFLPSNLAQLDKRLATPLFDQQIGYFLAINAALLALAAFRIRTAVIAFVLMIPNIIGSIGGSEKVGFSTHYHVYYFPILVWAAALGYERAVRLLRTTGMRWGAAGGILLVALILASVNFGDSVFSEFPALVGSHLLSAPPTNAGRIALDDAIPSGASVSTIEAGMPLLYQGRSLYLFPIGIDRAEYAVLAESPAPGGAHAYSGSVNFYGPAEAAKEDAVILARMRRDGYDLQHPVIVPTLGVAIFKRTP